MFTQTTLESRGSGVDRRKGEEVQNLSNGLTGTNRE